MLRGGLTLEHAGRRISSDQTSHRPVTRHPLKPEDGDRGDARPTSDRSAGSARLRASRDPLVRSRESGQRADRTAARLTGHRLRRRRPWAGAIDTIASAARPTARLAIALAPQDSSENTGAGRSQRHEAVAQTTQRSGASIGRRDNTCRAAALRRSELVALDVEDLAFDLRRGLLITIRASKTDQEQAGTEVAVPYARAGNNLCAVRTLQAYLEAAAIHRGPVFRRMRRGDTLTAERLSDQSVALIVKRRATDAGIRSEEIATLSGPLAQGRLRHRRRGRRRRGTQDRQRHPPQEPPRPAALHPRRHRVRRRRGSAVGAVGRARLPAGNGD